MNRDEATTEFFALMGEAVADALTKGNKILHDALRSRQTTNERMEAALQSLRVMIESLSEVEKRAEALMTVAELHDRSPSMSRSLGTVARKRTRSSSQSDDTKTEPPSKKIPHVSMLSLSHFRDLPTRPLLWELPDDSRYRHHCDQHGSYTEPTAWLPNGSAKRGRHRAFITSCREIVCGLHLVSDCKTYEVIRIPSPITRPREIVVCGQWVQARLYALKFLLCTVRVNPDISWLKWKQMVLDESIWEEMQMEEFIELVQKSH